MNRRPGSPLVVSVLLVLGFVACASPRALLGTYADEDDGVPRFQDTPDASADGAVPAAETLMCASDECVAPYATCPTSSHLCDTRLDDDPLNCGACGNACPSGSWMRDELNGASWTCLNGRCEMICMALGYANCNGYVEDGCETALGSNENCKSCGDTCPSGYDCGQTGCEKSTCDPPLMMCGDDCTDITKDDRNCGECGYDCAEREPLPPGTVAPPFMLFTCVSSRCNVPKCQQSRANCNQVYSDGCEVDLQGDPLNCGGCNVVCSDVEMCLKGKCVCKDACSCGQDFSNDPNQCGTCNHRCPGLDTVPTGGKPPRGHRTCQGGQCGYACDNGWANCNGDVLDGCEIDVRSDPRNCGACGNACLWNQACTNGVCATKPCAPGAPQ